jgi:phosphoribosylglycinamide formyltransferase 1
VRAAPRFAEDRMARQISLGVLISGNGTNLQSIIDAIEGRRLDARIELVLSNNAEAQGLNRAKKHSIRAEVVDHKAFASREAYDEKMIELLQSHGVELVVLAGFMRLLSPLFVKTYSNRIMNIHPALLPAFPGLGVQKKALEHGVRFSGCTVHFVNDQCDEGPIIIQAAVPVFADDTEETLAARILNQEHRIYPRAIQLFAEGRLHIVGRRVLVDGLTNDDNQFMVQPPIEG